MVFLSNKILTERTIKSVKIKVKHEGLLKVPPTKKVNKLSFHFEKSVK